MEKLSQTKLDELLGYAVNENPADVRQLLKDGGFQGSDSGDTATLSIYFLKAIKDSTSFRQVVADYLTGMVQVETGNGQINFVSKKVTSQFNLITKKPTSFTYTENLTEDTASANTTAQKSSFWSSLASSDNINSVLNSGLSVLSTILINKSNAASEQRALEAKALDLQIAQVNAAAKLNQPESKGLGTGWIIAISAVGVAGVATLVYFLTRNKKAA